MKLTQVLTAGIVSLCLLLIGCSGRSKPSSTGLVFTSPSSNPVIDAGQTVNITVNQVVNWSLQYPFGVPAGQLTNQNGTSVTYVAPAASLVTTTLQVNVVATAAANGATLVMPIVINAPLGIAGALSQYNTSCSSYNPTQQVAGNPDGTTGQAFNPNASNAPRAIGGTPPYTWSVASGLLPPGLALGWTSSNAYLFGTPTAVGCSQVGLQVTDATGATATSATNYVIIAPPALAVTVPRYPSAYFGVPYQPITLLVSGGVPPYTWNSSGPQGIAGQLGMTLTPGAASAVVSGTPNASPSNLPGNGAYTPSVTVYDSQGPYAARGGVTLNIYEWSSLPANACTPAQGGVVTAVNASLQGSYAFLLRGFDGSGPVAMAGSFVADGSGNVTGGVMDVVRTSGSQTDSAISGGSYSILQQGGIGNTFEQAGCLVLNTSGGSTTFALSMGGCSTSSDPGTGTCVPDANNNPGLFTTGRLIEFDDATGTGTRGSGIVRQQDSSALAAGLSGSFAFGLRGWDSTQQRYAEVGAFTANAGALSSVAADINDGGALQSALTGGSGTVGVVDSATGRATATLAIGTPALNNLALYVVSKQEIILVDTGTPGPSTPVIGGEAIATSGPFGTSSLQSSQIFHTSGLAASGPDVNIGILQFDGVGDVSGTQYDNQAATLGTTQLSGNYVADPNTGRLSFTATAAGQSLGDHPLVGYLIPPPSTLVRQDCVNLAMCVTGFLLSTDSSVQAGQLEFQTPVVAPPPPFSNLYIAGYYFYGTDEMMDADSPVLDGAASANPNNAGLQAIQSVSYPNSTYCQQSGCAVLVPNETMATATYSVSSNGSGKVAGETVAVTNGNIIFYLDNSPLNSHPSVIILEQ